MHFGKQNCHSTALRPISYLTLTLMLANLVLFLPGVHSLAPKLVPPKSGFPPLGRRAVPFGFNIQRNPSLLDMISKSEKADTSSEVTVQADPCALDGAQEWLLRLSLRNGYLPPSRPSIVHSTLWRIIQEYRQMC